MTSSFPNELISIILSHVRPEKIMLLTSIPFLRNFIKNNENYRRFLIEPFKKEFLGNVLKRPWGSTNSVENTRLLLFTNELLNMARGKLVFDECSYLTKYFLLFDNAYLSFTKTFSNTPPWYSNVYFW